MNNSVSELELYTFDVSSLTISNLVKTVEAVADGDHADVVQMQNDISQLNSSLARKITYQDFTATTSSNGAISLTSLLNGRALLNGIAISAYKQLILVYTDGWWAMFYNWPNFEKAANVSVTFRLFFYE